jgi:hypothetical protein
MIFREYPKWIEVDGDDVLAHDAEHEKRLTARTAERLEANRDALKAEQPKINDEHAERKAAEAAELKALEEAEEAERKAAAEKEAAGMEALKDIGSDLRGDRKGKK